MEFTLNQSGNSALHYIAGAIGTSFVAYAVYFLFFRPLNYVKALQSENTTGHNFTKTNTINRQIQMRKVGELPPAYPNSWYAVLESDEISRGQVREIIALGRNLVAWRGKANGKVFVTDPYCPHLGAHLGEGGTVNGDCIECPFHQWSFCGETGKVDKIPYSETKNVDNLTKLKMWPVAETNGYIYIWYHAEGHDPTWFPESIHEISTGQWKYRGRSEFWTTCHVQEISENGADVAHLKAVHEPPAVPFGVNMLGKFAQHLWSVDWKPNELPGRTHEAFVNLNHKFGLFGGRFKLFTVDVIAKQLGPGIVNMQFYTSVGRGVLIQSVTPIEPLVQRITHRFYSEPKFIHPFSLLVVYTEGLQIARDIEIWNRKCYLRKPVLVKEDVKIKQFRRWFSQFYSKSELDKANNGWKIHENNKNILEF